MQLELTDLPDFIQKVRADGLGWWRRGNEDAAAFEKLDTFLRNVLVSIFEDDYPEPNVRVELRNCSFKYVFPAFLSYLRSPNGVEFNLWSNFLQDIGFTTASENGRIIECCALIQLETDIQIQAALSKMAERLHKVDAPLASSKRVRGLYPRIANVVTVFYVSFLFTFALWWSASVSNGVLSSEKVIVGVLFPKMFWLVSLGLCGVVLSLIGIVLRRNPFAGDLRGTLNLLWNPLGNGLRLLPYMTRLPNWLKFSLFLTLVTGTVFAGLLALPGWSSLFSEGFFLFALSWLPISTFILFLIAAWVTFRYAVNNSPVVELMMRHREGRNMFGGNTGSV